MDKKKIKEIKDLVGKFQQVEWILINDDKDTDESFERRVESLTKKIVEIFESLLLEKERELLYKPNWQKIVDNEIKRLHNEGKTLREIGKLLGMSHENVNLRLAKYNFIFGK